MLLLGAQLGTASVVGVLASKHIVKHLSRELFTKMEYCLMSYAGAWLTHCACFGNKARGLLNLVCFDARAMFARCVVDSNQAARRGTGDALDPAVLGNDWILTSMRHVVMA